MQNLDAVRITVTAYTASFRVPYFVGHQLTLSVPPLSTVYGLISSAAGRWVSPHDVEWLAYRCEYESKAIDIEAIQTVERPKPADSPRFVARNVKQREFLTMPCLTLYLPSEWGEFFQRPRYPLLLGRTQDLASVESIGVACLNPVSEGQVCGVLLPLEVILQNNVSAWLHSLPIAFTEEPRRRVRGSAIFGVVDSNQRPATVKAEGWLVQDVSSGVVMPLYRWEWIERCIAATR